MKKNTAYKPVKTKSVKVTEPVIAYTKKEHSLLFFNSFEEQEEYEIQQMAKLKPIQILGQLRKLINMAYGMHGYNPDKLPNTHSIKIKH